MNFYPIPPTITAELYVRIPNEDRCIGQPTEWRGGFAATFHDIFLEGPVVDDVGNLYVVDIPYGRVLKISNDKAVTECGRWDGEPNGLAADADGDLWVADYKQVWINDPDIKSITDNCLTPGHPLLQSCEFLVLAITA